MKPTLLVLVFASGCSGLTADGLVKEGSRNEVSAIRTARGRPVLAEGIVRAARPPQSTEQEMARARRHDNAHSPSVELMTLGGNVVTCFLDAGESLNRYTPGQPAKLVGKFSDFLQDLDGHTSVVLIRCHP